MIHPDETRTPMAAILPPGVQTPVMPSARSPARPNPATTSDQHLLEVAQVPVQILAVGLQVQDRVADELPGAVVGHVPAAPGLEQLDAPARALLVVDQDVLARALP